MTEAFTKKAIHILDQAIRKDSVREFEIACKLYSDGIEYFETAISHEIDGVIKQQMIDTTKQYKSRSEYLKTCLKDEQKDEDDIISIDDFQDGVIVRLSNISISVMDQDNISDEMYDDEDDEQDMEHNYTSDVTDVNDGEGEEVNEVMIKERVQCTNDSVHEHGGRTQNIINNACDNKKDGYQSTNADEHVVAPKTCNCFAFF
eukprot:170848_1